MSATFDFATIEAEFESILDTELVHWAKFLKLETIRGIAIDCTPWHPGLNLSFLTTNETFPEAEYGKWEIGEWRLYALTDTTVGPWPAAADLMNKLHSYYKGETATDAKLDAQKRSWKIFDMCARVLASKPIQQSLQQYGYKLAPDFEFGVFDPDESSQDHNYCEPYFTAG